MGKVLYNILYLLLVSSGMVLVSSFRALDKATDELVLPSLGYKLLLSNMLQLET